MTSFVQTQKRRLDSGLNDVIQQANTLKNDQSPIHQLINQNSQTLSNEFNIDSTKLVKLSPSSLLGFISNLQNVKQGLSAPFVQNINLIIMPDPNNPSQNLSNVISGASNMNQLSYIFASSGFSPANFPIYKDSGIIGGTPTNSQLIPIIAQVQLYSGTNSITLQAVFSGQGALFAIALPANSTAIPSTLQLSLGVDGNNIPANASGYNIIVPDINGFLPPARVTLNNLTGSTYDVYYLSALFTPGGSLVIED